MTRSVVTDLLRIFKASYTAVLPDKIIRKCIKYNPSNETLTITGDQFHLAHKRLYIVGAGKAVQYMAREVEGLFGAKITRGIISIPAGSLSHDDYNDYEIVYCEGAKDNLPDGKSEATAQQIKELATSLSLNDVLLVLISGGGSALLPLPKTPIILDEKSVLIKKLANAGADIKELNIVRKRLSDIKGGKLAITASPAQVISLILSDIVDDPLDLIASGPTVEDKDDAAKTLDIIQKYNLYEGLPASIKQVLESSPEQVAFPGDKVHNYILGSNKMSILAAHNESKNSGYLPIVLSRTVTGNVEHIAKEYVKLAKAFADYLRGKYNVDHLNLQVKNLEIPGIHADFMDQLDNTPNPREKELCLILGGETTVEVKGTGLGGRNQQLSLEFSKYIHEAKADFDNVNVYMLSAGTDGIDGPTIAAGAIGYLDLVSDSKKANIDVNKFLEDNDCYNFYKDFRHGLMQVITGHTHTNVMDMHLMVVQRCQ